VEDFTEESHRQWDPLMDSNYSRIARMKPDELLKYNKKKEFYQLQGSIFGRDDAKLIPGTLVVHIDGACRNNGKPNARAAYGVYFGPNSKYNTSGLLSSATPQTSTRAEIEALVRAIDIIKEITDGDMSTSEIKIATDSSYLVNAIALWMDDWKENEGCNDDGKPVAHFDVLKDICSTLDHMEYSDDGGIECQMWLIPREENFAADRLANSAFN